MSPTAVHDTERMLRPGAGARAGTATSPAIVIGLDCATGLQTARILARRRVPVIGIARDPRHPCARTRACGRVVAADIAGPQLVDVLRTLGENLDLPAVVVPCTDMSVLLVSRHRGELPSSLRLSLPDAAVVEMLVDKARFYAFALDEGLPLPPTFFLHGAADAREAARALRYPAMLKPTVKTPEWERNARAKVYQVSSAAELLRTYDRCAPWTDTLVAQEWIAGGDTDHYTCNAYFDAHGEPLVTLTTRKLRQWPPTGGQACLSVEADDEAVRTATVELFRKVRHRGLGYLEMKRDARTGEYLIIEPNVGRPTGRSATAEAAGVELLYTMYCDALGLPLPEARTQRYRGTKWIHLRRDVQSALYHWRRGELTLRDWAASWRGPMVEALFSWRDPVPFLGDIWRAAASAPSRGREGERPGRAGAPVASAPA